VRKLWSVHDRGDDGGGGDGDGDHVGGSDGDDDGVDSDEDDGKKRDDYGDGSDSCGSCSVAYFRHLIRKELQLADMLLMILQNLKTLTLKKNSHTFAL